VAPVVVLGAAAVVAAFVTALVVWPAVELGAAVVTGFAVVFAVGLGTTIDVVDEPVPFDDPQPAATITIGLNNHNFHLLLMLSFSGLIEGVAVMMRRQS
jgi:hypothetical protein